MNQKYIFSASMMAFSLLTSSFEANASTWSVSQQFTGFLTSTDLGNNNYISDGNFTPSFTYPGSISAGSNVSGLSTGLETHTSYSVNPLNSEIKFCITSACSAVSHTNNGDIYYNYQYTGYTETVVQASYSGALQIYGGTGTFANVKGSGEFNGVDSFNGNTSLLGLTSIFSNNPNGSISGTGLTPNDPVMPGGQTGNATASLAFDLNITDTRDRVFIDPEVAVGYDYALTTEGQSFDSIQIATNVGDGIYDLWLWDGSSFFDSGEKLTYNNIYNIKPGTIKFSIRGIEASAGLDPKSFTAFVTGLTFESTGAVNMTQTAIVANPSAVPVPAALPLMASALGIFGISRRRNKSKAA